MDYFSLVVALAVAASTIAIHLLTRAKKPQAAHLPPGSLGLPLIGQSIGLLRALHGNTCNKWIQDRVDRYGPVSKLWLFGSPTVLLAGPAANKFIFLGGKLEPRQPRTVTRILGKKNLLEASGADHKRVRGAIMEFLRPEMLKMYVGKIDGEVRNHFRENWAGRGAVTVMPLMKQLTFNIITSLLFGLEEGAVRDTLFGNFTHLVDGGWAIPVNLPFTAYGRSIKASARIRLVLEGIMEKKKAQQEKGNDLVACLVSMTDGQGEQLLTDEEIVDNALLTLVAGHDTSSILMTFMVRHLADDPATLAAMVQEHEEIAKDKADGEALTWEDLTKMKFTWRVAQETLRIVPPVFGNFRRADEDLEFEGYSIPKGWQVLWAANVTHMDASIFHEPAKFEPSRFENKSTPPCSYVAFGGGSRICPGVEFAKIEVLVTMHHLVRQFRWKLRCKENTYRRDPMPSPLNGLPIEIEQRTSP